MNDDQRPAISEGRDRSLSVLTLSNFLNSPLRDTANWGRNISFNVKSLQATVALYESVVSGDICIYLGDVIKGKRTVVIGDRPGVVLGESIAQIIDEKNFIWMERVYLDHQSTTRYYALVMVSDGEVVVDQVAPLFDILLIDYLKIFILPKSAKIYIKEGEQGLEDREIEQLCTTLDMPKRDLVILQESIFNSIDISNDTTPRALPVEETMVQHGLILVRSPVTIFAVVIVAVFGIGFYLRDSIQQFISGEDATVFEETVQNFVVPEARGVSAIEALDTGFNQLNSVAEIDWWLLSGLKWSFNSPGNFQIAFKVGGLFADRVTPALTELGISPINVPPSDAKSETVEVIAEILTELGPRPIHAQEYKYYSTHPEVQKAWRELSVLTVRERVRQLLYYFNVESGEYTLGPSEAAGLAINEIPASSFKIEVQWKNADFQTIREFTQMISLEPVVMDSMELTISEVGLLTGPTTFLVYEHQEI